MNEQYAILAKKLALSIGALAFFMFVLSLYYGLIYKPEKETEEQQNRFMCGTYDREPLGTAAIEGKTIFINNCATCHNKNMEDKLTGPALVHWKAHLKNETEMFLFLTQRSLYFKTHRRKWHQQQMKEYGDIECVHFPNLTQEDVKNLIAYIEY